MRRRPACAPPRNRVWKQQTHVHTRDKTSNLVLPAVQPVCSDMTVYLQCEILKSARPPPENHDCPADGEIRVSCG